MTTKEWKLKSLRNFVIKKVNWKFALKQSESILKTLIIMCICKDWTMNYTGIIFREFCLYFEKTFIRFQAFWQQQFFSASIDGIFCSILIS